MAAKKPITVNGKTYTLQHPGVRAYMEATDNAKNENGIVRQTYMSDWILEHVVVDPKVKMEDFDDNPQSFTELIMKVNTFLGTAK